MKSIYKLKWYFGLAGLLLSMQPLLIVPAVAAESDSLFRVAYSKKLFSGVDLNDVQVAIDMWSERLATAVNKRLNAHFRTISSYIDPNQRELESRVQDSPDMISITTVEYLRIKNREMWEPLFCGSVAGSDPREQLLYLVPAHSPAPPQSVVLEMADNEFRELAELWLDNLKREFSGRAIEPRYDQVKKVPKTSRAVLDVFFGKAAACIVNRRTYQTMVELNPQLGKKLRVLHESPLLLFTVTCVKRDLSSEIKAQVLKTAIELPSNPIGQQLLKLFGGAGVQPFKCGYLDAVKELVHQNEAANR